MRGSWAIARRELGSYATSPVAYLTIAVFLGVASYAFFGRVFSSGEASLRDFFALCPRLFLLLTPTLTMRLVAEERRSGTFEALLALPIREWEIVLGKFLAALLVVALALVATLSYPLALSQLGELDPYPVATGYLGLLLLAGAYLAIGLLASSWTSSQPLALVGTLAIALPLSFVGELAELAPAHLSPVLRFFDLGHHYDSLTRGVVDSRDLVYFLSLTSGCLFLTLRSLEEHERG